MIPIDSYLSVDTTGEKVWMAKLKKQKLRNNSKISSGYIWTVPHPQKYG